MRLLLLVALCLAGALLVRAASAHASLERSTPSDGQQLATAPARVDLYFAQQLVQNRTGTFAAVFDGAGSVVSDEARLDPTDGKHLVVPLHAGLGADSYEVFWKTTSDEDGGVTLGNFSFSVGALPRGAAARLPGGQVLVPDSEQQRALSLLGPPTSGSGGAVALAAVAGAASGLALGGGGVYVVLRRRRATARPPRR